jgi:2-polyprenyl-3-methyl-5-hydroxy-6-metoxy-1,4-benzoquinol methylase
VSFLLLESQKRNLLFMSEKYLYNLEDAQAEAELLKKKVDSREAANYKDAEILLDGEKKVKEKERQNVQQNEYLVNYYARQKEMQEHEHEWLLNPQKITSIEEFKEFKGDEKFLIAAQPENLGFKLEDIIQKMGSLFPEKSLKIERRELEKNQRIYRDSFLIKLDDNYEMQVFKKDFSGFRFGLKDKTFNTIHELSNLYDLANAINDPEKTLYLLNRIQEKKHDYVDSDRIVRSIDDYIKKFGILIYESPVINYGTKDFGSTGMRFTLPHLFSFSIPRSLLREAGDRKKQSEDVLKILLEAQPLKDKVILEIGCGKEGRLLQFLHTLGAECVGLDIQEPTPDQNSFQHSDEVELYKTDITDKNSFPQKLKGRKFDYIISTMTFNPEVIGNTNNPVANTIETFLKDNGFAIFVPETSSNINKKYVNYNNLRPHMKTGPQATIIKKTPADSPEIYGSSLYF